MEETLFLIMGCLVALLVIFDFFFTTLSGSGEAFITKFVSLAAHMILYSGAKRFGRKVYRLSGMVVNSMVLFAWLILVWMGLFLVFSSNPEAIIHSSGRTATAVERFYYTGYTISTLGLGNFEPDSPFFEVLTSVFSVFGFIFFTASMTYLISVSSAVIHKRTLALAIWSLGKNPDEIVKNLYKLETSFTFSKISSLQEMVDNHSVNHQAYPVLHFLSTAGISSSFSVNIAALDEALTFIIYTEQSDKYKNEVQPLRRSITDYLNHIEERYSGIIKKSQQYSRGSATLFDERMAAITDNDPAIKYRRRILSGILANENFFWQDVYAQDIE